MNKYMSLHLPVFGTDIFQNNKCKICQRHLQHQNAYCSVQCYKYFKKDIHGYYNIKCMKCNKEFKTRCFFTDYCTNDCFNSK